METLKLEFTDKNLAAETAEALSNNGFIVETANDGENITLFCVRI